MNCINILCGLLLYCIYMKAYTLVYMCMILVQSNNIHRCRAHIIIAKQIQLVSIRYCVRLQFFFFLCNKKKKGKIINFSARVATHIIPIYSIHYTHIYLCFFLVRSTRLTLVEDTSTHMCIYLYI